MLICALYRSRANRAECLHRKLQRQPARRAAQLGDLRHLDDAPPPAALWRYDYNKRQTALITRKTKAPAEARRALGAI